MVPALQFTYWQWLSLTLAAPVVVYGGLPFHRAAWINLRHGAATMDTLVSLGTLAAFGWSLWALFLGTAGEPGHDPPVRASTIERGDGAGNIYLEAAAGVTAVHPRRPLLRGPVQAPRRRRPARPAGARRQGRRRAARRRRGPRSRSTSSRSATGSWSGPARRSPPTASSRTAPPPSTPACSPASRCRSRSAPGDAGGRRDRQRRRPAGRARHPGRRRHPAGADGRAGRAGADRQGRRCSGSPTGSPGSSCRS